MTGVDITPSSDGLKIQLISLGADTASYLETFNSCADGGCACSTDEFEKVESMQLTVDGDAITIEVRTKAGETIDTACVSDCMDYARDQAQVKRTCC